MSTVPMWIYVVSGCLAISGIGLFVYLGLTGARRSAHIATRLRGERVEMEAGSTGLAGQIAMRIAPRGGVLERNVQNRSELVQLLQQAGWRQPQAPSIFMALQMLVTLLASIAATAYGWFYKDWSTLTLLIAAFAGAAGGYLATMYVLRSKARARQQAIRSEVRIFVQLLTMIMDVGLSTRQTLATVSRDGESVLPNLSQELKVVLRQIDAGGEESEALRRMAQELDVSDLTSILNILRQVDRFGGGVKEPLLETLAHLEEQNKFRLQELVGKISARMTMVMVLFFLPALLAFTAGPGFLGIIRALNGG